MKKIIALLLISWVGFSQSKDYSAIQLSVNYGSNITLGGEILYQNNKNTIGIGYAGNMGTNKSYLDLKQSNYHVLNEALYFTYARQIKKFVIGLKYGKQNMADWNKILLSYNSLGNPNSHDFEKSANKYTTMVGVYGGYKLSNNFRINLGIDSFSNITTGFTVGF